MLFLLTCFWNMQTTQLERNEIRKRWTREAVPACEECGSKLEEDAGFEVYRGLMNYVCINWECDYEYTATLGNSLIIRLLDDIEDSPDQLIEDIESDIYSELSMRDQLTDWEINYIIEGMMPNIKKRLNQHLQKNYQ